VSAAEHAHQAVKSGKTALEVLTQEQARELDALTACIIPTDATPGAREAGVLYFIDHALKTFASDCVPTYERGLKEVQNLTAELFPGVTRFSAAAEEQKLKVLTHLSADSEKEMSSERRHTPSDTGDFFKTLRLHTVMGFLVDPEGGGNRDFVGWKTIGRDPAHSFSPPFGFYDKDYPGWQPATAETEKK
jgi:gluconate 2-dehydrogenase gamma chain